MRKDIYILFTIILIASCNTNGTRIYLGQGTMVGEITATSVILQSRLTASDTLINCDLLGRQGFGKFQVDIDSTFGHVLESKIIEAIPEKDYILKPKWMG